MPEHTLIQQCCWRVKTLTTALKIWSFSHLFTAISIILCFIFYDQNRIELLGLCECIFSGISLTSALVLIAFVKFIVIIFFIASIRGQNSNTKYSLQDKTMMVAVFLWTQTILEALLLIPVAYCMIMANIAYEVAIILMILSWIINFTIGAPIKRYYWEDKQSGVLNNMKYSC